MRAKPLLALFSLTAALLMAGVARADNETGERDTGRSTSKRPATRGGETGDVGTGTDRHANLTPPNRNIPGRTPANQTPPSSTPEEPPNAAPPSILSPEGVTGNSSASPAANSSMKGSDKRVQNTARSMADILKKTMGADTTAGQPAGKTPPPAAEPRVEVRDEPRTSEGLDLVAAASSGYGPAFRAEGLRAAPGRDGMLEIVDRAGRPADAHALESLRRRIDEQPRLLVRRPDLYQVIDPGSYGRLQAKLTVPGASSTPEFRHMSRPARDYVWTKNCEKVSGDCNPNAAESSYKKSEDVSPETLANIAKRLKGIGDGGDKDWAAYVEEQNAVYEKATQQRARGGFIKLPGLDRLLAGLSSALGRGPAAEEIPSGAADVMYAGAVAGAPVAVARQSTAASGARARGEKASSHGEERSASWPWLKLLLAALGTGIFFYARRLKRRDEPKAGPIRLSALALFALLGAPSESAAGVCASLPPDAAGGAATAAFSRALFTPLTQWFLDAERMQGPDLDALAREADVAAAKLVPNAAESLKACLKERRDEQFALASAAWREINVLHQGHDGSEQKKTLVGRGVDAVADKLRGRGAAVPADALARAREVYVGRSKVERAETPSGKVDAALERFEPKVKDPKLKSLSSFLLSGGFDAEQRRHWSHVAPSFQAILQSGSFSADERNAFEARVAEIDRRMQAQAAWESLTAGQPLEQKKARALDFDNPDLRDRIVHDRTKAAPAPEVIEASILSIKAAPLKYNVFAPPPFEPPSLKRDDRFTPAWPTDGSLTRKLQVYTHNWLKHWRDKDEVKLENVAAERDFACGRPGWKECSTLWAYSIAGNVVQTVESLAANLVDTDEKAQRHALLTTFTPYALVESVPVAKQAFANLWNDGLSWKGAGIALLATTAVALDATPLRGRVRVPPAWIPTKAGVDSANLAVRGAQGSIERDLPLIVRNAALAEGEDRIKAARTQLGLNELQAKAVLQAHEKFPCPIYLCTQEQLKGKLALLIDNGLSPQQAKDAIRLGLAGQPLKEGQLVAVPRSHKGATNGVIEAQLDDGRVLVRFVDPIKGPYTKKLFPDELQNALSRNLGDVRAGTEVSVLRSDGRFTDAVVDLVDGKKVRVTWTENGVPLQKTLDDASELRPRQAAVLRALEDQGVRFEHKVRVGDDAFSFSGFFRDDGGRLFALLRAETADGPKYSVVYRSNSSSVFRTLPSFRQYANHYDKGFGLGEEALALSPRLQEFLSGLKTNSPPVVRAAELDGLLPVARTDKEYKKLVMSPDYIRASIRGKTDLLGNVERKLELPDENGFMARPHDLVIRAEAAPDYTKPVRQYSFSSPLYGQVRAEVYASADGKLRYTLMRDEAGRAWFGDISDAVAPLTRHGVGQRYVKSEELLTPLWEYREQLPKDFIGVNHAKSKHYVSGWNYIREIPDIQRYYRERNIPLPR